MVNQWSYWSILDMQKPLVDMLVQVMFMPEDKKDPKVIAQSKEALMPLLRILDNSLAGKEYLVGNQFSLADLNVASVVHINTMVQNDISEFRNVHQWMQRLLDRSAFKKVLSLPR